MLVATEENRAALIALLDMAREASRLAAEALTRAAGVEHALEAALRPPSAIDDGKRWL
jgi:hypothetical protein